MKKKILSMLLALALALSLLPVPAFAADSAQNAASVTFNGATTEYATMEEAWTAATDCETTAEKAATITLLQDCTATATLYNDSDYLVLDLGGKTLSVSAEEGIYNSQTLTIQNGTVLANTTGSVASVLRNYADLILTDCTVSAKAADGALAVENYGYLSVTDSTLTAEANYLAFGVVNHFATATLHSGSIAARHTYTGTETVYQGAPISSYGIYNNGDLAIGAVSEISGGTVDIYTFSGSQILANDGGAPAVPYAAEPLTIQPELTHGETLVQGVTDANKDLFLLCEESAQNYPAEYVAADGVIKLSGKPQALTWYDADGTTVLSGSTYPASAPYFSELETLPTAPEKDGQTFLGWLYRASGEEFWSDSYAWDNFPVDGAYAFKAVYARDLTPVTDATGTYFPITSAEDLLNLSRIINAGYEPETYNVSTAEYRLMNDIDLSSVCGEDIGNFPMIGTSSNNFAACLNGNGKTISGLYIYQEYDHAALFSYIGGESSSQLACVKDLTLIGNVTSTESYASLLAYEIYSADIKNVTLQGTVTARPNYSSKAYEYASSSVTVTDLNTDGVTLIPYGYTLTKDGHMGYAISRRSTDSHGFYDVIGNYKNEYIQTTYSCGGYEYGTENMDGATVTAGASSISGGHYVKLTFTVTAGDTAVSGGKLGMFADIQVGDDDFSTIEAIKDGDKVIGIRMGNSKEDSEAYGAQVSLYFANSAGVTDADTYWFGAYSEHVEKCMLQLDADTASTSGTYNADYTSYSGEDSAMGISWQNINLEPGQSKTFSFVVGVGEAAAPVKWGENSLTLSKDTVEYGENATVTASIVDTPDLTEELYVSVDGGEEILLGTFTSQSGETTTQATLDSTKIGAGTHTLQFWVMNEEGAMSPLDTKTFTVIPIYDASSYAVSGHVFKNGDVYWFKGGTSATITAADGYKISASKDGLYGDTLRLAEDDTLQFYLKRTSDGKVGGPVDVSDILRFDGIAPTLENIQDGKTYYGDLMVVKPPNQFHDIASVTLDGEAMGFAEGLYGLVRADNGTHTVVVTDHVGNATTYTITVMKRYTVTYMADGAVVDTVLVDHGKDAPAAPQAPAKEGYTVKWDKEVGTVTGNVTVTAIYTRTNPSPDTGDEATPVLWIALLAISACAVGAILTLGKKQKFFK